jgi:hypothetical protein
MSPHKFWLFWFSKQGWMALWVALRRSRRDPRARLNLLRLLLFLAYLIAIVVFYSNLFLGLSLDFGRIGNLIVWGIIPFFLLIFILVGILQRRLERRAQDRDNPAVPATTKLAIYREACLLAILLERLSSEIGMEKELPEDIEVITRRVLLDRLAELNLRDNLEPELRDILLAPDGHWPQELKQRAFQSWECFTVLRWVLGLGALTPLTEQPNYKLADINVLFAIKQLEKLSVLPAWDVRPARNNTMLFFNRCWSELIARGAIGDVTEEAVQHAIEARETIQSEGYNADFLVGVRTVPELQDQLLWQITVRTYHRMQMLALLVDVTSGDKPTSEIRTLFAGFFTLPIKEEMSETPAAESSN